jgi:hypothetical protein
VVVWQSYGSGGDDSSAASIQLQRFASNQTMLGGELQVNGYTTGTQGQPSVAAAGDGFVVVWEGYAENEDILGIRGRLLEVPDPIFSDGYESGNTSAWSASVP